MEVKKKKKKAIRYLLECFISDHKFLTQYMDQESIFDRKDDQIIQNIKDAWDKEIQNKLQQIVVSAFSHERLYVSDSAQFIKLIALSLKEKDKNYIFGLITEIKKVG